MSQADAILARIREIEAARAARPPIDYERMHREFPKQKRRLTLAVKSGDRDRVLVECARVVREWDEIGAWPDDWSHWQGALNDVFPVFRAPDLRDLA